MAAGAALAAPFAAAPIQVDQVVTLNRRDGSEGIVKMEVVT